MKKLSFFEQFIGTSDITYFLVLFAFALIGAFISLRWQVHKRNKRSSATPEPFSWKFMLLDNINRIVVSIFLIFLGLRFSPALLGVEMNEIGAVVLGASLDKVSEGLKNLSLKARK